ncbi:MAG: thiol:disulfide interchange protein DsbA/DsbL [Steroidobacteraceae bacterium]
MKPLIATLAASWLVFVAACSPDKPATPATPPAPASEAPAAAPAAAEAPPQASVTESGQVTAAAEISEIEDQQETVEEAPAPSGSLRLRDLSPVASAQAQASRFQQGVNYKPLVPAQPTSVSPGQVEAVEIFWYGCPHCFALDPSVESWRKSGKAPYVQFVRVPAMWNDMLKTHARLFYTVEALGKLEELHPIIFREINVSRNLLDSTDKIVAFLGQHGVTADEYKKAANSFAVEAKLRRAEELNRRYRVQGVPMVVVNGKYTADVGSAGGNQQLLQLIDELAARERG